MSSGEKDDPNRTGHRFEIYQDDAGEWRWRYVHRNGNILADSGQGYASKQKCRQGIRSLENTIGMARHVDVSADE